MKKLKLSFYKNNKLINEQEIYEVSCRRFIRDKNTYHIYFSISHIEGTASLNDIFNNPGLYQEMGEMLKEYDRGIISINTGRERCSVIIIFCLKVVVFL